MNEEGILLFHHQFRPALGNHLGDDRELRRRSTSRSHEIELFYCR